MFNTFSNLPLHPKKKRLNVTNQLLPPLEHNSWLVQDPYIPKNFPSFLTPTLLKQTHKAYSYSYSHSYPYSSSQFSYISHQIKYHSNTHTRTQPPTQTSRPPPDTPHNPQSHQTRPTTQSPIPSHPIPSHPIHAHPSKLTQTKPPQMFLF